MQRRIVLPLFLAAFLATFLFGFGDWSAPTESAVADGTTRVPMRTWLGLGRVVPFDWWICGLLAGTVCGLLVLVARFRWAYRHHEAVGDEVKEILPAVFAIFIAASVGGVFACGLFHAFVGRTMWEVLVWGPPSLVAAFLAILGDGVGQEGPAKARLLHIEGGCGGIRGLELRRRSALRESRN